MNIQIYDTTLRDGTQREGLSLSSVDKIRIARQLGFVGRGLYRRRLAGFQPQRCGIFPDARKDMDWKWATICAFGSTCRVNGVPEDDANIKALLDAGTPVCTVVGKSWTLHVTDVLRTTLDENLRIIEESLAYLGAMANASSTTPSIFSTAIKPIPNTPWKPCAPRGAAGRKPWCCATPTVDPCPAKSPKSSARCRQP